MKSKTLTILLVIMAILLGILFFKNNLQPKVPVAEDMADIIKSAIHPDNLSECNIRISDKTIELRKENDQWIVKNRFAALADKNKLESFIKRLDVIQGELRSNSEDVLADYGITDQEAVSVELKNAGSEAAYLLFGTKKAGLGSNFVRSKGSPSVYVIDDDVLAELGFWEKVEASYFVEDQWFDKKVVQFDPVKVTNISFQKQSQPLVQLAQEKQDDKVIWKTSKAYPFAVDKNKVDNFLVNLSGLQANSIAAVEEAGDLNSNDWELHINLENNQTLSIRRFGKDTTGNNYYVKASDKNYVFLVSTEIIGDIEKTDGDFFVDNPLAIEESSVKEGESEKQKMQ